MALVLLREAVHIYRAYPLIPDSSKKNSARGETGLLERYDITNRIEHDEETDDDGGSKAYPSRTSFGWRWEVAQKAGIDTGPLKIFGIPISGMLYYVNWVLTTAQLELIASDVSVIDYGYDRKKKKKGKKGEYNDTKANQADVDQARKVWLERYGDSKAASGDSGQKNSGRGGIALSDIFAGSLNVTKGFR